jgi:hypothetical protein
MTSHVDLKTGYSDQLSPYKRVPAAPTHTEHLRNVELLFT